MVREFRSVAEHIQQDLPNLGHISVHHTDIGGAVQLESIAILLHEGTYRCADLLYQQGNIEWLQRQMHLASFDLGEIKNVINQREQMIPSGANLLQVEDQIGMSEVASLFLEQLAIADDTGQGGSLAHGSYLLRRHF